MRKERIKFARENSFAIHKKKNVKCTPILLAKTKSDKKKRKVNKNAPNLQEKKQKSHLQSLFVQQILIGHF